jgi:hypothetical protein
MRTLTLAGSSLALVLSLPTAAQAGDLFEVKGSPAKATAGAKGKTSLTLAAKNGWHLNEEAPVTVKLTAAPGVTLDKPKLTKADATARTQEQARFDVGFIAAEAGSKTIDAEASFVICQAEACKPVKEKIVLAIDVSPGAPPAAAPAAKGAKKK